MRNDEYFLIALQNKLYERRDWVLSCFTVTQFDVFENFNNEHFYHCQLIMKKDYENKLFWFNKDDPDNPVGLEQFIPTEPLFRYSDKIALKQGDLINVKSDIVSTYGNCIFNCIALIYPFGDKINFVTGKVNGKKIEAMICANLHDTPADGEPRESDKFYVDELVKHANAVTSLEAFNYTCVPTTSESTMLPNKEVVKLRDELLEKHKHELDKPEVIAQIQAQLAALDKKFFENDRAKGFYLSGKAYDIIRMKKFTMLGMVGGFGGNKPQLVTNSLAEGWDVQKLPAIADDIRAGSYSRGKQTAIAGADVKSANNALQAVTVNTKEEDCGATRGMSWYITPDNVGNFNGLNMITKQGLVELNKEILQDYIGKTIEVRTPMICKNTPPSYCAKCVGKSIAMLPNSVHIVASNVNSIYMNNAMKAMHGKSLKTKRYNIFESNK